MRNGRASAPHSTVPLRLAASTIGRANAPAADADRAVEACRAGISGGSSPSAHANVAVPRAAIIVHHAGAADRHVDARRRAAVCTVTPVFARVAYQHTPTGTLRVARTGTPQAARERVWKRGVAQTDERVALVTAARATAERAPRPGDTGVAVGGRAWSAGSDTADPCSRTAVSAHALSVCRAFVARSIRSLSSPELIRTQWTTVGLDLSAVELKRDCLCAPTSAISGPWPPPHRAPSSRARSGDRTELVQPHPAGRLDRPRHSHDRRGGILGRVLATMTWPQSPRTATTCTAVPCIRSSSPPHTSVSPICATTCASSRGSRRHHQQQTSITRDGEISLLERVGAERGRAASRRATPNSASPAPNAARRE